MERIPATYSAISYPASKEVLTALCVGSLVLAGIGAVSITIGLQDNQTQYVIIGIFAEIVAGAIAGTTLLYSRNS